MKAPVLSAAGVYPSKITRTAYLLISPMLPATDRSHADPQSCCVPVPVSNGQQPIAQPLNVPVGWAPCTIDHAAPAVDPLPAAADVTAQSKRRMA